MDEDTQAPTEEDEDVDIDAALNDSEGVKATYYIKRSSRAAFARRAKELGWSAGALLNVLADNIHRIRLVRLDKIPK